MDDYIIKINNTIEIATKSSTDDELSNSSFPIPCGKKILLNIANDKRKFVVMTNVNLRCL